MANRLDGKGSARLIRIAKQKEAEDRDKHTSTENHRSFWRDRGFSRKSHATRLVAETVSDCNKRAAINKQRAQDWPLIPEEVTSALSGKS